jgi:hypothetical protein
MKLLKIENIMTKEQKQQIIDSGKDFFREIIIPAHLKNLNELQLKDFNVNPFLINYLAAFLCGNTEPESLAKALVYPRVLGTSINTTFGTSLQSFITEIQAIVSSGSAIPGIDIEFEDNNGINYNATFLPDVAEEEGWDQRTTLKYLVKKAGYKGTLDKVLSKIKLTRYQSIKNCISYDEYKMMK